jgi:hypothetical protein
MNTIPLVYQRPKDGLSKWQRLDLLRDRPGAMDEICQRVAEGETLKAIADGEMVPYGLLQMWITRDAGRLKAYREAERMKAGELIHEAINRSDDNIERDEDGNPVLDENNLPIKKDIQWARLQVQTRLKAAQMLDAERFVQAAKPDAQPLSDSGIAQVAKHLAGAFAKRNLPGSEDHIPQDIEAEPATTEQERVNV